MQNKTGCNSHSGQIIIIGEKTEECRLGFVKAFLILLVKKSSNAFFFWFWFFLVLLAQKSLSAIFCYNFSFSSYAGEFSHHFVFGKSVQETVFVVVFFFTEKMFYKNIFSGFFF